MSTVIIGAAGAGVGILLSVLGARVVADIMYRRLGLVIEPGFEPRIVLGMAVGTIALASVAGIIPAVSAYRTSVIRNLRPAA